MPFWTGSTPLNVANMARLGPFAQGFVGTEGAYADLYTAMGDPAGPQWRRVVVLPGATLNGDISITGVNEGFIVGLALQALTGTGSITLTDCSWWTLHNLFLANTVTATAAIDIAGTGGNHMIDGCRFAGSGASAVRVANNYNRIMDCTISTSASHGIEVTAAATADTWIERCRIRDCTGWGVRDLSAKIMASSNHVLANTAGQISTTSTYLSNNRVT